MESGEAITSPLSASTMKIWQSAQSVPGDTWSASVMDSWSTMCSSLFTPSEASDLQTSTSSTSVRQAHVKCSLAATSSRSEVDTFDSVSRLCGHIASSCFVSDGVSDPAAPSSNWLTMALANVSSGITDNNFTTDESSSPLSLQSSSPVDSAWNGSAIVHGAAAGAVESCQSSHHSSDSGNSSAASRDASLFGSPTCSVCEDSSPRSSSTATHHCTDCSEFLCFSCAYTHRRMSISRGHSVVPVVAPPSISVAPGHSISLSAHSASANLLNIASSAAVKCADSVGISGGESGPPGSSSSGSAPVMCALHPQASLTMLCNTCQLPLCYTCALHHAEHSLDTLQAAAGGATLQRRLLAVSQQAQSLAAALQEARQRNLSIGDTLRQRCARVQLEVAAVCDKLRAALNSCQQRMERKALTICQMKVARLQQQDDELEQLRTRVLHLLSDQLSPSTAGGASDTDRLVRCILADRQLRSWLASVQLSPVEDAALRYMPLSVNDPRNAVDSVIAAAGRIESTGCAHKSVINEPGCTIILGKIYRAIVQVRDHYGDECLSGGDSVQARVVTPDRRAIDCEVQHLVAARYQLSFTPQLPGLHHFSVLVNGAACGGVWTRRAVTPRRLSTLGPAPRLIIGREGCQPGQFCRPWGVAFSSGAEPRLAVSDRSNHRVQVFCVADGRLLFTFGQLGQRCGELNRPAGLAFMSNDCLVVADKDNHRVCIFSAGGQFMLKFGEKGSRLGMFNYPWDVACNSLDQIAVSDTRNHRIQLFSSDGVLMKKFSQEGADWKELDSPRGLAFHPDGRLFITDFNNHRLIVLDTNSGKMIFIGREGSQPTRFLRPQGIATDEEGRVYVSDCRNSRIQVLSSSGEFLMKLGEHGSRAGQFDQPQGVAVGAAGLLAVVCLENHRVQLF